MKSKKHEGSGVIFLVLINNSTIESLVQMEDMGVIFAMHDCFFTIVFIIDPTINFSHISVNRLGFCFYIKLSTSTPVHLRTRL